MIILSLNVRGLGFSPKNLSLIRLFCVYNIDIILLQETMVLRAKAIEFLSSLLQDWRMCSLDVVGISWGPISAWNSSNEVFNSNLCDANIFLEGEEKSLGNNFKILNFMALIWIESLFGRLWNPKES